MTVKINTQEYDHLSYSANVAANGKEITDPSLMVVPFNYALPKLPASSNLGATMTFQAIPQFAGSSSVKN